MERVIGRSWMNREWMEQQFLNQLTRAVNISVMDKYLFYFVFLKISKMWMKSDYWFDNKISTQYKNNVDERW